MAVFQRLFAGTAYFLSVSGTRSSKYLRHHSYYGQETTEATTLDHEANFDNADGLLYDRRRLPAPENVHILVPADGQFRASYALEMQTLKCYAKQHGYTLYDEADPAPDGSGGNGPWMTAKNAEACGCVVDRSGKHNNDFFYRKHCMVACYLEVHRLDQTKGSNLISNESHPGRTPIEFKLATGLPRASFVFVFDADVLAGLPARPLDFWIQRLQRYGADLALYERCQPFGEIAAGNYIAANSDTSVRFLRNWARMVADRPPGFSSADNGAIHVKMLEEMGSAADYQHCYTVYQNLTALSDNLEPYAEFVQCCRERVGMGRSRGTAPTKNPVDGRAYSEAEIEQQARTQKKMLDAFRGTGSRGMLLKSRAVARNTIAGPGADDSVAVSSGRALLTSTPIPSTDVPPPVVAHPVGLTALLFPRSHAWVHDVVCGSPEEMAKRDQNSPVLFYHGVKTPDEVARHWTVNIEERIVKAPSSLETRAYSASLYPQCHYHGSGKEPEGWRARGCIHPGSGKVDFACAFGVELDRKAGFVRPAWAPLPAMADGEALDRRLTAPSVRKEPAVEQAPPPSSRLLRPENIHVLVPVDQTYQKRYELALDSMRCMAKAQGFTLSVQNPHAEHHDESSQQGGAAASCYGRCLRQNQDYFFCKHCQVACYLAAHANTKPAAFVGPAARIVAVFDADTLAGRPDKDLRPWLDAGGASPESEESLNSTVQNVQSSVQNSVQNSASTSGPSGIYPSLATPPIDISFYERCTTYEVAAGNYVARNSPAARAFLAEWAAMEKEKPSGWSSDDNGAIHVLLARIFGKVAPVADGARRAEACDAAYKGLALEKGEGGQKKMFDRFFNMTHLCRSAIGMGLPKDDEPGSLEPGELPSLGNSSLPNPELAKFRELDRKGLVLTVQDYNPWARFPDLAVPGPETTELSVGNTPLRLTVRVFPKNRGWVHDFVCGSPEGYDAAPQRHDGGPAFFHGIKNAQEVPRYWAADVISSAAEGARRVRIYPRREYHGTARLPELWGDRECVQAGKLGGVDLRCVEKRWMERQGALRGAQGPRGPQGALDL